VRCSAEEKNEVHFLGANCALKKKERCRIQGGARFESSAEGLLVEGGGEGGQHIRGKQCEVTYSGKKKGEGQRELDAKTTS